MEAEEVRKNSKYSNPLDLRCGEQKQLGPAGKAPSPELYPKRVPQVLQGLLQEGMKAHCDF
jgi:hypothetical protein